MWVREAARPFPASCLICQGEAPPPDSFELPCRRQQTRVRVRVLVIAKLMIRVIYLLWCRLQRQSSKSDDDEWHEIKKCISLCFWRRWRGGSRAEGNGCVVRGWYISTRTCFNFINRYTQQLVKLFALRVIDELLTAAPFHLTAFVFKFYFSFR